MSGVTRLRIVVVLLGIFAGSAPAFQSSAQAQAVAFEPTVSPLFSGAMVGVTPVVSADRRYVRMSLDVSFTHVNGFTTYSVPAAVSGGPGGPGALGGLNGQLGGGGGGGATGRGGSLNQGDGPLAGPYAFGGDGGSPISRNGQNPDAVNWPMISANGGEDRDDGPTVRVAPAGAGQRRSGQAKIKALQSQRAAALRASRQQTLAAVRRSR